MPELTPDQYEKLADRLGDQIGTIAARYERLGMEPEDIALEIISALHVRPGYESSAFFKYGYGDPACDCDMHS